MKDHLIVFTCEVEKHEDTYLARIPELPYYGTGKTPERARDDLKGYLLRLIVTK